MQRRATFDTSGTYRYTLTRRWKQGGTRVAFIMLNPSRADGRLDDPTIRRCIGFARQWGHHALQVVNLYGFRTPEPRLLFQATDPVGPENDRHLTRVVARADRVVCAWGVHGLRFGRGARVAGHLRRRGRALFALGLTADGAPRHPLFLKASSILTRYVDDETRILDQ